MSEGEARTPGQSEARQQAQVYRDVTPYQIVGNALRNLCDSVDRYLDSDNSSDEASELELPPHVIRQRVFPVTDIDASLLQNTDGDRLYPQTDRIGRQSSLVSYESGLFSREAQDETHRLNMATAQGEMVDQAQGEQESLNAEGEQDAINRASVRHASGQTHMDQAAALDQIIDALRNMQDRIERIENGSRGNRYIPREHNYVPREQSYAPRGRSDGLLDITYGRTLEDVRNHPNPLRSYIKLKEARDMIPEIDGTSRSQVQKFINASTYAMSEIDPLEERSLLKAILCTKLTGKAMYDFQNRDIRSFLQLRKEIEMCYLAKRSTTHIQKEFNSIRQKPNENAREYGLRVDKLAMELYQSMIEGKDQTADQRKAILETIQELALENFQLGLRDEIQTIVRSRNYSNLTAAILGATAEEKLKGPPPRASNGERAKFFDSAKNHYGSMQCHKCGKTGHDGRDCRTSRYANKFTLPHADKSKSINTIHKYCTYCKKTGHKREECWTLNGRPADKPERRPKAHVSKKALVNTTTKVRSSAKRSDKETETSSSSSEDEDSYKGKKRIAAKEGRMTQIIAEPVVEHGLHMITLSMKEAKRKKIHFLLDTGATQTILKVGCLKHDTLIKEEKLALTGVTGHKIYTIGKIKAHITIGEQRLKHTIYIVGDDFPMDYEGILGIDFLTKHKAKCDLGKKQVRIGGASLKLHPFRKLVLPPRSETIIQAITDKNRLGLVKAKETTPGVYIGSCLVEPEEYTCPISVLNVLDEPVVIQTPHVTLEEAVVSDTAEVLILQTADKREDGSTRAERVRQRLRTKHLNKEEKKALEQICEEYGDVFHLENENLTCTAVAHEINIRADSAPINVRPYRLPEKHKKEVNEQIIKMLKDEIIRHSTSQWNAPILVVLKKADASGKPKLRIVVDFRKLNDLTIGDSFPIPNITDILDQLGSAKYFTTLDLASGYHQIPMEETHKQKTAFSTPYGHYEFNRMPFGLKNAPATFQRLMNSVLTGMQGIKCLVYLDDIVIYGSSLTEHNKRLIEVLRRLRTHNLKLQPDKCEFLRKEVIYLGHIITEDGISPDPSKITAVKEFPTPKRVKDVQAFIGLAGYYRKFIDNFSKIAKPLTTLTKKGKKFEWGLEHQNAFDLLKEKLTTAPVLNYPDFTKEFLITTDASDYAVGAVLSQGPVGEDRPIAYASRILNKAEQNYNTTEKELLAIVWAVKHFRPYVYGTKFKIITDHKPLTWLFSVNDPGSRLIRWRLKLEEYDYEIEHKAGKKNANADALSRNVGETINTVADGAEENETESVTYSTEDKQRILYEYHDAPLGGHQGIARTLKRIKLIHNWPGMAKDVEEYIQKCKFCQKNKLSQKTKMPMIITDTPEKPFEKCALDIVGPLPVTNNGNKYVLTFQDHLTKFSKAIPIENQEAATVAKAFVTKIITEYGIPEIILTDQGTNFTSEMFKNMCKLLRINKIQTTAYHPESNGALERSHRTLAEYLRHYINEEQSDWDEWIPYAMFAYNTTPHTATGFTPFELVFGHQASLPTALTKPPKTTYSYDDYAQELRERLRASNQVARENAKQAKNQAKTHYDKTVKKEAKYRIGDTVLLYDETVRRGRSKKLDAQWTGPYKITEKHNDVNYSIKRGRTTIRVHANRIKPFIES